MAKIEELDSSVGASVMTQHAESSDAQPPAGSPPANRGFVNSLVASVFEPGVNPALVLSMHASFFLLLLTLGGLAFLTGGNGHVLTLMGCSLALWAGMGWFVLEITRVQGQKQNQPPDGSLPLNLDLDATAVQPGEEDAEVIKSEAEVAGGLAGETLRRR